MKMKVHVGIIDYVGNVPPKKVRVFPTALEALAWHQGTVDVISADYDACLMEAEIDIPEKGSGPCG